MIRLHRKRTIITMDNKEILQTIRKALDDKKGEDIVIIDVTGISVMMDYIVICTGNNINQIRALVDNVEDELRKISVYQDHTEGVKGGNWILMDYKDILINIFDKEARQFYDLEHIWSDGKRIEE